MLPYFFIHWNPGENMNIVFQLCEGKPTSLASSFTRTTEQHNERSWRDQRKENDIDIGIVVGPLPDLTMKGHWWQIKVLVKPKTQLKIPPLVPRSKLVTDAQGKLTVKSEMPWKQILLFSKWETHLTKPVQNPARPLMLRGAAARGALTFFRLTREDNGIALYSLGHQHVRTECS